MGIGVDFSVGEYVLTSVSGYVTVTVQLAEKAGNENSDRSNTLSTVPRLLLDLLSVE